MKTKEKDLRKFVELMKCTESYQNLLLEFIRQIIRDKQKAQRVFEAITKDVSFAELIDNTINIYDNIFTHNEIKELISFYKTDTGQKFIANAPHIVKLTLDASIKWARDIVETNKDIITEQIGLPQNDINNYNSNDEYNDEEDEEDNDEEDQDKTSHKFTKIVKDITDIQMAKLGNDRQFEEANKVAEARYKFAQEFSNKMGWDINNLTVEQVLRIRMQEGWINPKSEE